MQSSNCKMLQTSQIYTSHYVLHYFLDNYETQACRAWNVQVNSEMNKDLATRTAFSDYLK